MFRKFSLTLFLAVTISSSILISGCKDSTAPNGKKPAKQKMLIYTSIQPIAFITSKIAGRYADVKALIPQGKSPHSFALVAKDLSAMSKASFFFSIRLPFEELKLRKAFKGAKTQWVNIAEGVKFLPAQPVECGHEACKAAKAKSVDVTQVDPHIWLNPENDLIMARNICNTLSKAMPQHAKYFELNFQTFTRSLITLDKKLEKMLAPYKGEVFLVYHPAFAYFADRYGLKQEAVELGGKTPSPKHLQEVIKLAKKKKVKIIFVQPEFNRKAAKVIAKSIKGSVIKLDPLAYKLIDNYIYFGTKIQSAMKYREGGSRANEK